MREKEELEDNWLACLQGIFLVREEDLWSLQMLLGSPRDVNVKRARRFCPVLALNLLEAPENCLIRKFRISLFASVPSGCGRQKSLARAQLFDVNAISGHAETE